MPVPSPKRLAQLRRKAPQLIVAAIVIAIISVILFEILEDIVIERAPLTSGPVINAIVSLTRDVTATVSSWGYYGIFLLMLLESVSLPIPSEVVLPLAGYLVSTGQLNIWVTIMVATVAGVAGSLIDYYIGLKGVRYLAEHRVLGRVFFTRSQLEVAVRWFSKYGAIIVLLSRLIPGFRTIVSFPAGAVKMPLAKFVAYTTIGCLIWNSVLIYVGIFLGKRWREVAGVSHYLIYAAVAGAIVLLIVFFVRRRSRKTSLPK
jgi:membrane protein DedA with SNARE-associated domain